MKVPMDSAESAGLGGPWSLSIVVNGREYALRSMTQFQASQLAGRLHGGTMVDMRNEMVGLFVDPAAAMGLDNTSLLMAYSLAMGHCTARHLWGEIQRAAVTNFCAKGGRHVGI